MINGNWDKISRSNLNYLKKKSKEEIFNYDYQARKKIRLLTHLIIEIVNTQLRDMSDIEFPLIIIIMTTFERTHTIERTIDSILNQTYKYFELIIIDDGSMDNRL